MQLRVAKLLNKFLAVIIAVIIIGIVLVLYLTGIYPNLRILFVCLFIAVAVALMAVFRWFESQWDKKIITRMVRDGKIALVNILSAERIMPMRDSSFVSYWLYEFKSELYDSKRKKIEKTFYEKMARETDIVPAGSVYVTYDEAMPGQVFIIPNVMISHMPHLAPVIKRYESDKSISVKYLDAYYNKGMVLKNFKETVPGYMEKGNR